MTSSTLHLGPGALVVLLAVATAAAEPPSAAEQRCVLTLDRAGTRVAAAAAGNLLRCVRAAAGGKLPAGQTADQCVAADAHRKLARARTHTVALAARVCQPPADTG